MTLAEYAEQQGNQRLRFELECKENLYIEARSLFTLLAAGMAAALGYAFTLLREGDHDLLLVVAGATTVHLALAAWYTLDRALGIREMSAIGNEPSNILHEGNKQVPLDTVIEFTCANLTDAIRDNNLRNRQTGQAIKLGRLLLVLTPVTACLAWAGAVLAGLD